MSYENISQYYQWQHIYRWGDDDDVNGFVLTWRYLRRRLYSRRCAARSQARRNAHATALHAVGIYAAYTA